MRTVPWLLALLLASLPAPTPSLADATKPDGLHAGPMLGWSAARGTAVWLQTTRAARVQLRYHPQGKPGQARLTKAVLTQAGEDYAHTFILEGLDPGTTYGYEVYLDRKRVVRGYPFRFKTRPFGRHRKPAGVKLLIGSCAYINDRRYETRRRRPYGGGYEIFQSMARVGGDAMIWLGDNVYFRGTDYTEKGLSARYRHDRFTRELQPLLAAMNHYATWDDHDYGPNNSDATFQLKDASLAAFKRYWPAIRYGLPKTKGVFQRVSFEDLDLFLLDTRYHRTPNRAPRSVKKRVLGKAQLRWLKQALLSSRGAFKLITFGNQVFNRVTPYESMHLFEHEVDQLVGWIVANRIPGVVFLSGDRHHTELLRENRAGCYPLYEFTSSPLTSSAHRFRKNHPEWINPKRVAGTLVQERNFGVLRVEGGRRDRRLILETRSLKGKRLWRHEIRRSLLRFPRRKRKAKLY